MTLGNMRQPGRAAPDRVLPQLYLRHQAIIDVSRYPADTEVTSFRYRLKWGKCGRRGRWVDVRPNWKEQPEMPDLRAAAGPVKF
jgi:hypothetical protein